MSNNRQAAKIDANQPQIVDELRKAGFSVEPGHDDILVGKFGITGWFEIKNPELALSKKTGKVLDSAIEPSEKKRLNEWRGHYQIVWRTEQILDWFKMMLKKLEGR